jgi:hypothetical protein
VKRLTLLGLCVLAVALLAPAHNAARMHKAVRQYSLAITGQQTLTVPASFTPIAVQARGQGVIMWAECNIDPLNPQTDIDIRMLSTDEVWPSDMEASGVVYLATVQIPAGTGTAGRVWHVYWVLHR